MSAPPASSHGEPGLTGRLVSHYRVGPRLGIGGMGEVYRAEDTRLGREVALKFLHEGHGEPEERARLLREARAASALRSSNIAAIYDLGEMEARPFIVMELVPGEPLSKRIMRGPIPVSEAAAIAAQAADALDEAHSHGIIHRDIKSANLMVDDRGRVKLLDFGLAKFVSPAAADAYATGLVETAAGLVLGTVAYMSPEQVRGRPLDARSDLFSLGVVLYEMLAGRLPFDGRTVTEVVDAILNHEPSALARFNYGIPERLEVLVRKSLSKDPRFRYQSARELYIDLHDITRTHGPGSESGRAHRASGAASHAGDRSKADAGSAPGAGQHVVAVMTFSNTTREPGDDWIGSGIAETLTADLKQLPGVVVLGRAQVFDAIKHLSGTALERVQESQAIDIGRRLGATRVIGGAYQRLGPLIRITAECVNVQTGELTRTVKVDGRVDDIFSLQDRIVADLAKGLRPEKARTGVLEAIRKETESIEAFEAFSRGLMNLRLATRESLERAVGLFEQALGHDPGYASAWALLGVAQSMQGQFLTMPSLLDKAVDSFQHALAIDAANVYALSGIAGAHLALGRPDDAIAAASRALELDPHHLLARGTLARAFWVGKGLIDEGIAVLEHAVENNPDAGYVHQQLALLLAIRGDLDRAGREGERAVALQESLKSGTEGLLMVGSHVRLGYVRYLEGRYDLALQAYEKERAFLAAHDHALKERLQIEILQKQSAAHWRKGDRAEADRTFAEALRAFRARQSRGADDPFTKYYMAALHGIRGDAAEAVRYLQECLDVLRALTRARARRDPDFDAVRSDPAFRAAVELDAPVSAPGGRPS